MAVHVAHTSHWVRPAEVAGSRPRDLPILVAAQVERYGDTAVEQGAELTLGS